MELVTTEYLEQREKEFKPFIKGECMSDRGYIALALEAEVKAIEVEVEGMKVANRERAEQGHALAYGEENFRAKADRLREISKEIRALV